jgi:hypothetical protein
VRERCHGSILAALTAGDGVERGPGGAPTAFRIWKAGANPTDHGVHIFSEASARTLMAEQAARGNLFSIDADHLSLDKAAPPEARKAVGWHRLAVRDGKDGPELWAVNVEWTDAVKAGLEKSTPEWRYFSPAYDVDKKTREIVAYLNTALTNNPATWSVTQLATLHRGIMNYSAIAAALFGDDDDAKKEARAAIARMTEAEAKAWKAVQRAAFDPGDGEKKEGEPEKKKDPEPEKEGQPASEDPKKEQDKIAASAKLLTTIGAQERRLGELEKIQEGQERAKILATRPDLTPAQLQALADEPLAKLTKLLGLIPAPATDPAAADKVMATRGAGRDGDGGQTNVRAAKLPPAERAAMRERMGVLEETAVPHWERNDKVYPQMTREGARRFLAARGGTPPPKGGQLSPQAIAGARERALSGTKGL